MVKILIIPKNTNTTGYKIKINCVKTIVIKLRQAVKSKRTDLSYQELCLSQAREGRYACMLPVV